ERDVSGGRRAAAQPRRPRRGASGVPLHRADAELHSRKSVAVERGYWDVIRLRWGLPIVNAVSLPFSSSFFSLASARRSSRRGPERGGLADAAALRENTEGRAKQCRCTIGQTNGAGIASIRCG